MTSWSAVPPSPPAPASGVTGAPSGPPDSLFPPAAQPDPPAPPARPLDAEFRDWFRSPEPAPPEDLPAPPADHVAATAPIPKFTPTTWSVVVTADRAYFDQMQMKAPPAGPALPFPAGLGERRFALAGTRMRIGRRSAVRGVEPEIDLSEPPADPGISRLHALLLAAPDGSWALLDVGSANGTLLNGREIAAGDLIPLHDGDQINLGAWTTITVRRG